MTGLLVFGIGAACTGDGSDIGPKLPRIPDTSSKVVVLDDQGRGVVSATVTVVGSSMLAFTGRNGRGDFLADPRGRVIVHVDGRNAAAVAGDRLPELRIATTILGPDLPSPIHLPDLPDAASMQVMTGSQAATTVVTSIDGSMLTVGATVSVGTPDGAATVELRLGDLTAVHLPGDLPIAATGTILFGSGIYLDPPAVSFVPAVDLDMADDLVVGATAATLYHLDATTGEWQAVAVPVTSGSGRLVATAGVATGGLYAFGVPISATTVSGRVIDVAGNPLPDAMVRIDQGRAITDGAGRFVVTGIAATAGDGSPRMAAIELFAGGSWLPVITTAMSAVSIIAVDVGDLTLDTLPSGNIRVQQVLRARADALRPARLSSVDGSVAQIATSDANGQVFFQDMPSEFFGFQEGRPRSDIEVFYGSSLAFLERGDRWLDNFQFLFERRWFIGSRSTLCYISDSVGGGPIEGAEIVAGSVPATGRVGATTEAGTAFFDRTFAGRATASFRSQRGARSITHAISFMDPNSDHLEFPIERVLRDPLGAFDRHGLVEGTLTGANVANQHALSATRRFSRQEWWDDVVEGYPIRSSLPIDVDPAVTHGPFRAGLTVSGGHLAAIEFTMPAGIKTLQSAGLLTDFVPVEGALTMQDVPLEFPATASFVVVGATNGVDVRIDLDDLTVALALEQEGDRLVDVARDLRGNLANDPINLTFTLPQLTGALAGRRWLALVQGATTTAAGTFAHASSIALPAVNDPAQIPPGGFTFPSFPLMSAPPANATVPASGFTVNFSLPANALFGTLELRQDTGTELLLWRATVPVGATAFSFVTLPPESKTPLLPGRTYTLTLSAWFGEVVTDLDPPYGDLVAFAQSVAPFEAGVTQVARQSIQITTN